MRLTEVWKKEGGIYISPRGGGRAVVALTFHDGRDDGRRVTPRSSAPRRNFACVLARARARRSLTHDRRRRISPPGINFLFSLLPRAFHAHTHTHTHTRRSLPRLLRHHGAAHTHGHTQIKPQRKRQAAYPRIYVRLSPLSPISALLPTNRSRRRR